MKVMEISPEFGLKNLRVAEKAEPVPGPGQVRIRMRAAAINFRDLMMVDGRYNPRQPLPLIPCSALRVTEITADSRPRRRPTPIPIARPNHTLSVFRTV